MSGLPLTLYFVRAQFVAAPESVSDDLDLPTSRLGRAVVAAASQFRARPLTARNLPLSRLLVRPEAMTRLDALRDDPGPQAYLFTSANAVRALGELGRLDHLDRQAPLYCVGARSLEALRALGFDGPALQAPTAALLENAIMEGPLGTLGCGQAASAKGSWHYFCATQVSHDFKALDQRLRSQVGQGLQKHSIYAAQALPHSDARLRQVLERIKTAPDQALMLVYSRALARHLGAWLASAGGADWRAHLPVLCLSPAIAVELEAWDLRKISVAQTPDEEGLAVALSAALPGLALAL